MSPAATLANSLWRLACEPARRRLRTALKNPAAAQQAVLQRILRTQQDTAFARTHGLRPGMTMADFQNALPVGDYDAFSPWIERMKQGAAHELCPGLPVAFERSSGSTAAAKYLPLTEGLKAEFQEAVRAWMGDLMGRRPQVGFGPAWWLISPLRQPCEVTPGGTPVGLPGDDEYLGRWERKLASALWAVPPAIAEITDLEESLDWTLRFLLQTPGLRLISVWNPSYLELLWRRLETRADEFLQMLARGTGPATRPALTRHLRACPARAAALAAGPLTPDQVWPRLAVISAWADVEAAADAARLAALFPQAALQPKGLLATEGVVTVPWLDDEAAGVPALNSHFLEFQEWPGRAVRQVAELQPGQDYAVLLTTSGGLWRYRLGDLVRMEGSADATPRLRLVGRCDDVCDLRGEKLSAAFSAKALHGLVEGFRMLAPWRGADGAAGYILFVGGAAPPAVVVEAALAENPHYAYARRAGQLQALRVFQITQPEPREAYVRRCVALGQRAGAVKPVALHRAAGWESWFQGHFLQQKEALAPA